MRPRRFLLALTLLWAGCAGVGTEPLPGQASHHVAGGFRNPDPAFKRPDGWTRWSFFARRVLASLVSPRSFDAPRVANDGATLRAEVYPALAHDADAPV